MTQTIDTPTNSPTPIDHVRRHQRWLWIGVLPFVWLLQYSMLAVVAGTVGVAKAAAGLVGFAVKGGLFMILLLCLPIIGWVILAVMWASRRADRRNEALIAAMTPEAAEKRSMWRPWMLDRLQAA
jgi:hypothetical protein